MASRAYMNHCFHTSVKKPLSVFLHCPWETGVVFFTAPVGWGPLWHRIRRNLKEYKGFLHYLS